MTLYTAKIGEIVVGKKGDQLQALALGSCIGLVVYDPKLKVAALAHILLPEKSKFSKPGPPGKYGTEAIGESIKNVISRGGLRDNLVAKLAGGAKMFESLTSGTNMDIGSRNIASVTKSLGEHGIKILARDVGDNQGRTIIFDVDSCLLKIKQANGTIFKTI